MNICQNSGKLIHSSFQEACRSIKNSGSLYRKKKKLRPYKCPVCQNWHITHNRERVVRIKKDEPLYNDI